MPSGGYFSSVCVLTCDSIFELQQRRFLSFVMVSLLWPLAMLLTPIYFGNSPGHLFFTYLVPLLPFVWVYDGYISCLRTRTREEVQELMKRAAGGDEEVLKKWKIRSGEEVHTAVIGKLFWIVATKEAE